MAFHGVPWKGSIGCRNPTPRSSARITDCYFANLLWETSSSEALGSRHATSPHTLPMVTICWPASPFSIFLVFLSNSPFQTHPSLPCFPSLDPRPLLTGSGLLEESCVCPCIGSTYRFKSPAQPSHPSPRPRLADLNFHLGVSEARPLNMYKS